MKIENNPALSLKEWLNLSNNGENIPVITTLKGNSMAPLIRKNRDIVTIVPFDGKPKKGQIIVYKLFNDVCIAHRIYKINNDEIITIGDNCPKPDYPVKKEMIIGIITQVQRDKLKIRLNNKAQFFYGKLWNLFLKKLFFLYINIKNSIAKKKSS